METSIFITIPFTEFKEKTEEFLAKADLLLSERITDEEQLKLFEEEIKNWDSSTLELLKKSFSEENNSYAHDFKYANSNNYIIPNNGSPVQLPIHKIVDDKKIALRQKRLQLYGTLKIVSISDKVLFPDREDLKLRKNYTINEKLKLILSKLYDVHDDCYYPIKEILENNGVILKTSSEERELAKILENNGYIEILGGLGGFLARLTSEGVMYIEENWEPTKEDYSNINQTSEELNAKIEEIIETLKKQGLGQEILFEELQELKELYTKLNKKNWGQVLKGKLVDIGLAKLVENDTLKFIYENLTDNEFLLPK